MKWRPPRVCTGFFFLTYKYAGSKHTPTDPVRHVLQASISVDVVCMLHLYSPSLFPLPLPRPSSSPAPSHLFPSMRTRVSNDTHIVMCLSPMPPLLPPESPELLAFVRVVDDASHPLRRVLIERRLCVYMFMCVCAAPANPL